MYDVARPVTYSLKYQSRALTPLCSDTQTSQWVVGTNALREENELTVLQYDTEQDRLAPRVNALHLPEIWDIATSCRSADQLLTVWSQAGTFGVSLWSIAGHRLKLISDLPGHEGTIRGARWHPTQPDLAVTIEEGGLRRWQLSEHGAHHVGHAQVSELLQLWSGALNPADLECCATVGGNGIQLWDLRTMARSAEQAAAHRMPVRDVSFAPGGAHHHHLLTGGDDCKLRLWDLRKFEGAGPLLELGGHTHWVWRSQFSPFHGELMASASSDSLVNLHHVPQLASGAPVESGPAEATNLFCGSNKQRVGELEGRISTFEEHDESVYGLAWSAADPWLFASLSYDGRVVLNKVPKDIKYKILVK